MDAERETGKRDERDASGWAVRRGDLRCELRRARGRARAGRLGRRRPGPRPLRDRRAPDLRLRDTDRLAARAGHDRPRAAALRRARRPYPGRDRCSTCPTPSRPSTTTRSANGSGASATPSSRSRRSPAARGEEAAASRGRDRPRAGLRAAGRRRPRLAADARLGRPLPARRGAADPGAGGPSRRGHSEELEVWVDRRYARAGYGWCFPAGEELRIGACSYEPRDHVRKGTDRLAADLGGERVHYQGNWIPHELRPPTEGGVFFAGDSAGQCLALTAEGIRTALYFGIAVGRELRAVFEGRAAASRRSPGTPSSTTPTAGASASFSSSSGLSRGSRRGCWRRSSASTRPSS